MKGLFTACFVGFVAIMLFGLYDMMVIATKLQ